MDTEQSVEVDVSEAPKGIADQELIDIEREFDVKSWDKSSTLVMVGFRDFGDFYREVIGRPAKLKEVIDFCLNESWRYPSLRDSFKDLLRVACFMRTCDERFANIRNKT